MTVIATLQPRDGQQGAVVKAVAGAAERIHAESGRQKYTLHRSGRSRLILVELWRDQKSLEAHSPNDAYREVGARLDVLLNQPPEIEFASPCRSRREEQGSP